MYVHRRFSSETAHVEKFHFSLEGLNKPPEPPLDLPKDIYTCTRPDSSPVVSLSLLSHLSHAKTTGDESGTRLII